MTEPGTKTNTTTAHNLWLVFLGMCSYFTPVRTKHIRNEAKHPNLNKSRRKRRRTLETRIGYPKRLQLVSLSMLSLHGRIDSQEVDSASPVTQSMVEACEGGRKASRHKKVRHEDGLTATHSCVYILIR